MSAVPNDSSGELQFIQFPTTPQQKQKENVILCVNLSVDLRPLDQICKCSRAANTITSIDELTETVAECSNSGATVFRIVVHKSTHQQFPDFSLLSSVVRSIKHAAPDCILELATAGADGSHDLSSRCLIVRMCGEMASMLCGAPPLSTLMGSPGVGLSVSDWDATLTNEFRLAGVKPVIRCRNLGLVVLFSTPYLICYHFDSRVGR